MEKHSSLISNNVSPLLSGAGTSSSPTTSPFTRSPAWRRQSRPAEQNCDTCRSTRQTSTQLPRFDADLVGWLTAKFSEIGIDVRTGNTVIAIERARQELHVQTQTSQGVATVAADLVVHAAGRVPDIAELNLSAGQVEVRDGRLRLNEYLQSV